VVGLPWAADCCPWVGNTLPREDVRVSGRANTPSWVYRRRAHGPYSGTPPAASPQLHSLTQVLKETASKGRWQTGNVFTDAHLEAFHAARGQAGCAHLEKPRTFMCLHIPTFNVFGVNCIGFNFKPEMTKLIPK
jgi:hypothetical protein